MNYRTRLLFEDLSLAAAMGCIEIYDPSTKTVVNVQDAEFSYLENDTAPGNKILITLDDKNNFGKGE